MVWAFFLIIYRQYIVHACSVMLDSSDPMDWSPPGSSVPRISQARTLEWVAISSSRGSPPTPDGTGVSCVGRGFFITESPGNAPDGTKSAVGGLSFLSSFLKTKLNLPTEKNTDLQSTVRWAWTCVHTRVPSSRSFLYKERKAHTHV